MKAILVSIVHSRGAGYLAAILGIAAVIAVGVPFHGQLDDTIVALALLLVVLFIATLWGRGPGMVAAMLGMLGFKFFFLPPLYSITIADPENWTALAAFLITASTVGHLSVTIKRRAAEAEAERKAARLASAYNRSLIEASLDPLVTIGPDGKITDVNAAAETVTGQARGELIGTDFSDYFTDPEQARAGYQQAFRQGFVRDYALELRHRDGHITAVLYNASVYRDESGQVLGVFAAARDITERKRAEEAVQKSAEEIRDLYNNAPCGYHSLDEDGVFVRINDTELSWLGYRREEVIGKMNFADLLTAEMLQTFEQNFSLLKTEGAVQNLEFDLIRKDGTILPVLLNATAVKDRDGNFLMSRSTVYDITARKRAEAELRESERRTRLIIDTALDAVIAINTQDEITEWNPQAETIFGWPYEEAIGSTLADLIIPLQYREAHMRGLKHFLTTGEGPLLNKRIEITALHRDGHEFPVELTISPAKKGETYGFSAFVRDITARKRAEDEIRMLARLQAEVAELGGCALRGARLSDVLDEAVTQVVRALNVDYCKVLELLPSRQALLLRHGVGWKPGYVGQATVGLGTASQAGYTLLSDQPVVVEDLRTEKRFAATSLLREHDVVSGISVIISTKEGPYGVLGVHTRHHRTFTRDEIHFLQAVANILGSAIERYQAETQLRRLNRTNRALSRCNEVLIRATDESTLLQQICDLVIDEAGYRLCWVGLAEHDEAKSVRLVAQAGFEAGYLDTLHLTWADTERGRGPTGTCIRTRQTVLSKHIATDPTMLPWRAEALKRGYASSIAIPLSADSVAFGAINIYAPEPEAFGPEEVRLLTELADDLAFGITTLRTRMERARAEVALRETEKREEARKREIEIGFKIQQILLLNEPPRDVPGLRVAALTIPSQRIDGDFYDFFTHDNQCLDVIVADVMGKGIPAALLGAATKSQFLEALSHLIALSQHGKLPEPKDIVTLAHAEMVQQLITLETFVTLCYARLDLNAQRLNLVDCGHTGVMHFHAQTDLCDIVHGDNLPLGIRAGEIFDQIAVPFEPGDVFIFYSDGVTEARNATGQLFGEERLADCVRSHGALDPEALVEAIRQAVCTFTELDQLTDDLTCVAIRVEPRQLPLARAELELRSDLSELRRARAFVRAVCSELPGTLLAADRVAELELAVNEATSNIMKHAYHGRTDQRIHLEAEAFPDQVVIRLHHVGDPCDPSSVAPPVLDGSRESGFGLYLIKQSVDDVRYSCDARGRNCITLVKSRRA